MKVQAGTNKGLKRAFTNVLSTPYIPHSWGNFEIWGTPPNPPSEGLCPSELSILLSALEKIRN
jgi:hypothetical protein